MMNEMDIQFTITDSLFLNTMLCQLRGTVISFAKKKANDLRKEEKDLLCNIETVDNQLDNVDLNFDDRTCLCMMLEHYKEQQI